MILPLLPDLLPKTKKTQGRMRGFISFDFNKLNPLPFSLTSSKRIERIELIELIFYSHHYGRKRMDRKEWKTGLTKVARFSPLFPGHLPQIKDEKNSNKITTTDQVKMDCESWLKREIHERNAKKHSSSVRDRSSRQLDRSDRRIGATGRSEWQVNRIDR